MVPGGELREGHRRADQALQRARKELSGKGSRAPGPLAKARKAWEELKKGEPGCRFQDRYKRKNQGGSHPVKKVVTIVAGGIVLAAGIFFLPAPGPGMIIVAIGAALIAQESLVMARLIDKAEVFGRRVMGWVRDVWDRGGAARAALVVVALVVVGVVGYGMWWMTFGRN